MADIEQITPPDVDDLLPVEKERLIESLLTYGSTAKAAKVAGIPESTARRWQRDERFLKRWRQERWARYEHSIAIAQSASEAIISMLITTALDPERNIFARLTAARAALEHASGGIVVDHEERLQEIEHQLQERAGTPAAVRRMAS